MSKVLKTNRYKIVWQAALTRYPPSIHFHTIRGWKMTKFTKWENWQTLTAGLNPNHMHVDIQTMEKRCAKLHEDWYYIVWQVALKGTHCHFHKIWGQKMTKFTKWKWGQKYIQELYPNHMHIFRPWRKHMQSFKKIGIKLYEELCSQGTHCLYIEVKKWQSS